MADPSALEALGSQRAPPLCAGGAGVVGGAAPYTGVIGGAAPYYGAPGAAGAAVDRQGRHPLHRGLDPGQVGDRQHQARGAAGGQLRQELRGPGLVGGVQRPEALVQDQRVQPGPAEAPPSASRHATPSANRW